MSNAYKLIIEDDEGRRSVVPVELGADTISVGRDTANTICLNERNVSRRHARFINEQEGVFAEDLSSFNGVWVNGQRIRSREAVFEGDIVRIGDFSLELRGEGLKSREEDATERMDEPTVEATQRSYNLLDESSSGLMEAGEPEPIEPLSFEEDTSITEVPEAREEKTAIIRMSDFAEEPAADGNTALAGDKAKLVCVSTQLAGQTYEIDKVEMVLGRTEDNDIPLPHRSVSRHHARIVVEDGRYSVLDQTSANGTLVNNEEYAQVELKSGDLIELGHVKLRFVPPGESYSLTDEEIEALQEVEEASTRDSGPFEAIRPEPTDVRESPKQRSVVLGLVSLLGVLAIVWAIVRVLMAPAPQPPQQAEQPAAPAVKESSTIDEVLKKAKTAASERRWSSAEDLAKAALLLEPGHVEATEFQVLMVAERKAQGQLEQARADIRAQLWEPAWNGLNAIPESSAYHADALSLLQQARGALISQRITAAQDHIAAGRWDDADALTVEIASLDPMRPELPTLQDKIRLGREQAEKAQRRAAPKRAAPKPPAQAPAQAAKPVPPPPAPPEPAPPALSASDLFAAGVNAVKKKNFDKALEFYRRCIQVDKQFGQCYRALGIVYARTGDAPKAARYYKLYLKVNPGAPDAARVRELLKDYESN